MHLQSSVGLTNFVLNHSTEYFFCSHGTIFRYFYEVFYTFGYIMPFDSDLTQILVQVDCYKTFCTYFYSFHDHSVPFLFQHFLKIFIFAGFILVALIHPVFIWYW